MSILKPWRQVATPHADIRHGKFDSSVFAADLGEVLAGRGAVDYRDACTFFSKTYLTAGLTQLVIDVMQRLAGTGKTEPVIQLQTAFGGGKTHTLLTLYHLLNKPERGRQAAGDPEACSPRPASSRFPPPAWPAWSGPALNADRRPDVLGRNGLPAWRREGSTPSVAKNDEQKIAPGTNLLGEVLGRGRPVPDPARRNPGLPHQGGRREGRREHAARQHPHVPAGTVDCRGQLPARHA